MTPDFEVAPHVRATAGPQGKVLLDLRQGRYFALNAVGGLLWDALAAGVAREQALQRLARHFPEVSPARLAGDVDALLAELQARGLVQPRSEDARAATAEASPATQADELESDTEGGRVSVLWFALAGLGLVLSDVLLVLLGFSRFHGLIRRIPRRTFARAGGRRARRIVASVDAAAGLYFKRAWCLQRSAVTVTLLRLAGFPASLVIGVQPLPFSAHAWVELHGRVLNDRASARRDYEVLEAC